MNLCSDPATCPGAEGLTEAVHPELLKSFKPAFLGRLTVVPYFPLTDAALRRIVELHLGRIRRRVADAYRATFDYAPEVVDHVVSRCSEVETGARNIDHILSRTMLPEISTQALARMAEGNPIKSIAVLIADGRFEYRIA